MYQYFPECGLKSALRLLLISSRSMPCPWGEATFGPHVTCSIQIPCAQRKDLVIAPPSPGSNPMCRLRFSPWSTEGPQRPPMSAGLRVGREGAQPADPGDLSVSLTASERGGLQNQVFPGKSGLRGNRMPQQGRKDVRKARKPRSSLTREADGLRGMTGIGEKKV